MCALGPQIPGCASEFDRETVVAMAAERSLPTISAPAVNVQVVPPDIEIAQAATPVPIAEIASAAGILPYELDLYGNTKAKVHLSIRDRLKDVPERQVHRGDRHHSHPARRGQDHHDGRSQPGAGRASGQEGIHLHPPAQPGTDLRHQGRRGRRRLQPDHPHGGVQPPSDRRYSRHHGGEQSAGRGHRHAHLP